MLNNHSKWEKLGRSAMASENIWWMKTWTGPSFLANNGNGPVFDIYLTGRDDQNRSRIGRARINLEAAQPVFDIEPEPLLDLGELGCFDENGVSYPVITRNKGRDFMYYVGWMPSVLTPFLNFPGLAIKNDETGTFERYSRVPVLERTNEEPFSIGSVFVMEDDNRWKMWYTSFLKWGEGNEHLHYYVIRYAESDDGIDWNRTGKICINIENETEYAICKPCVIKRGGIYHMWYTYRGAQYRIGYAVSEDGISWTRRDDLVGINVSDSGWDSEAMSYPHVVEYGGYLYMIYCGNQYGKEGIGLARLPLK
jgi:hypothetical protein